MIKNQSEAEYISCNVPVLGGDLENFDSSIVPKKVLMEDTNNKRRSNKCNQCDFTSSVASKLLSGEKSNKCNQCDYACFQAGNLRKHLKTHSGEKSNRCNQCDYTSSQAGNLKTHLKTHSGKSQTNAANVTMPLLIQAI